jgi:uncharacterized protein HemY
MKSTVLFLSFAFPLLASAETIFLKDGKVHAAKEMRREGNFLFLKVAQQDGSLADVITPLNQIERVDFGEVTSIAEARQLARSGDALGVLEKTQAPAAAARVYSDIPGNLWPEVMRLRLPAIAVSGNLEALSELQKQWTPTGDGELDTAYKLLVAAQHDPTGAKTARGALTQPGANSLAAGLSWLTLGEEALEAKNWRAAVKAFLSVEVFIPSQRLLQPKALLGAAKAFLAMGEKQKASSLLEEVKAEFPSHTEAAASLVR